MTYARDQLSRAREEVETAMSSIILAKAAGDERALRRASSQYAYWLKIEALFAPVVAEEDAELARLAVFTPAPIDQLGLPQAKWTCDRDGNWSLAPFERFTDDKGAMADRRIETKEA